MAKVASLCLATVAAAAVAVWALSPSYRGQAQATPEAILRISPFDLHKQVDTNSLPVQDAAPAI
jgi:hypothetical protein